MLPRLIPTSTSNKLVSTRNVFTIFLPFLFSTLISCIMFRITGSKKQSDEGAALFAARVHAIVSSFYHITRFMYGILEIAHATLIDKPKTTIVMPGIDIISLKARGPYPAQPIASRKIGCIR